MAESKFSLRVEENIFKKLRYVAEKNKRSVNSEIEFIIEKAVKNYESKNGVIQLEVCQN